MFSDYTTLEEFNNVTITGHFRFVFEQNTSRDPKSHPYRDTIVLKMLRNAPCPHENENPLFSIPLV